MPKETQKLPSLVYIYMEPDGEGGHFPLATNDIKSIDEGVQVGVYRLDDVVEKVVTHGLRS